MVLTPRTARRQDTIGTQQSNLTETMTPTGQRYSDARYSYPKMTPDRVIGTSPGDEEDGVGNGDVGGPEDGANNVPPAYRQQQSNMTELTDKKQGYGKSMHAIESKPFEVVENYEEQEEDDEMPPSEVQEEEKE